MRRRSGVMDASRYEAKSMGTGFEFEGCLQPGSGIAEALNAAGIDCHAPLSDEAGDASSVEPWGHAE